MVKGYHRIANMGMICVPARRHVLLKQHCVHMPRCQAYFRSILLLRDFRRAGTFLARAVQDIRNSHTIDRILAGRTKRLGTLVSRKHPPMENDLKTILVTHPFLLL
jgi:hypothetical protein